MQASLVPSAIDLAALIAYVLGNPYLFISSSTVMTTGLVIGAVALVTVPRGARVLRFVAPPLAMLLAYFGIGSIVLATEILVRFHGEIPDATETQFASGVGHLLGAAAGVAFLYPHLRQRSRRGWVAAKAGASAYWTAQVLVLTPPGFALARQLDAVRPVALAALSAGAPLRAALWRRSPPPR